MIIDGYTPKIFVKKNKNSDNHNNSNDFNYNDYIDDEYDDSNEMNSNSTSNNDNDNGFTKVRAIVSFDSKDLLCQWMDNIEVYSLENRKL